LSDEEDGTVPDDIDLTPEPPPDSEDSDQALLTVLRAAAHAIDPVPPSVVSAAKGSWTWRTIDAELAELTYDSWTDEAQLAGVRGASTATPTSRLLSFEATSAALELEIIVEGPERRLVGQLLPAQPGVVEVHHRRGVEVVEADAVGRFSVPAIAPGLFRLTVRPARDPRAVATAWIQV
jgi:hypothetical protein